MLIGELILNGAAVPNKIQPIETIFNAHRCATLPDTIQPVEMIFNAHR
jgi:hypothetical protein